MLNKLKRTVRKTAKAPKYLDVVYMRQEGLGNENWYSVNESLEEACRLEPGEIAVYKLDRIIRGKLIAEVE